MTHKQQRIKDWVKTLETIIKHYKELDEACDKAIDAGCLDPNGPIFQSVWAAYDSLLNIIDKDGWIAWFIFDNHCGKKEMKAGFDGKLSKIRTIANLARLIVEQEDRK